MVSFHPYMLITSVWSLPTDADLQSQDYLCSHSSAVCLCFVTDIVVAYCRWCVWLAELWKPRSL